MMRIDFDIPSWIQNGLDSGEYIRRGGVVYNRSGGIVKHLKESFGSVSNEDAEWSDDGTDADSDGESDLDTGLAVLGGLALVGLAVAAVASVAHSSRRKKESRRELDWRIAEARSDSAQVLIPSQRIAAPAGWYDDGSTQLRWWDGQAWTEHYYTADPRVGAPAGWYDDGSSQLRWWDGQAWTEHYYTADPRVGAPAGWYDDGSGRQRWWDGYDWTQNYQGSPARSEQSNALTATRGNAYSSVVEGGHEFRALSLNRAQWEEQVRVMLQARVISELQWRFLSNARIEDADAGLLEWQGRLRGLTAQEFSHCIDRYVASDPAQALELATAGWYDDGSGRQRWWDGLEWTDYFQTDESRMLPVR